MQHICFPDLGKEKLCTSSILIFWECVCVNIVVRVHHDNVARRGLLDVLTPLSDGRQASVEKMERKISGVSYMCWMDFHNGILCCGFSCARLISVFLFSGYHAEGYRDRKDTFKLTGYHVWRVTTPELPRSKQTSGYKQVTTPAGSF